MSNRMTTPLLPTGKAQEWTEWVEWVRTSLSSEERTELLSGLTYPQAQHLEQDDYAWLEGIGVVWKAPGGSLQRARFTHGAYFRTKNGDFFIDSEGSARRIPPLARDTTAERGMTEAAESRRQLEVFQSEGGQGG